MKTREMVLIGSALTIGCLFVYAYVMLHSYKLKKEAIETVVVEVLDRVNYRSVDAKGELTKELGPDVSEWCRDFYKIYLNNPEEIYVTDNVVAYKHQISFYVSDDIFPPEVSHIKPGYLEPTKKEQNIVREIHENVYMMKKKKFKLKIEH